MAGLDLLDRDLDLLIGQVPNQGWRGLLDIAQKSKTDACALHPETPILLARIMLSAPTPSSLFHQPPLHSWNCIYSL